MERDELLFYLFLTSLIIIYLAFWIKFCAFEKLLEAPVWCIR